MSSIIQVSNLSKAYRIGERTVRSDSLIGLVQHTLTAPWRNWRAIRQPTALEKERATQLHWALQDVSFEVQEGEVLGIIGRNGAGKSTLLKILSRITEPSSGEVRLHGRVASLLEVGTGFHPELTGRENVYLNGTILGMQKCEIDRNFDAIVDFSGVAKFLDTPIKRYSSGMKVRLAFAVAAHLDPEILIVDEVLAVGDADFQKKCTSRMGAIAASGRTVLFVSHQIGVIQQLCTNGLLLSEGRLVDSGKIEQVISTYNHSRDHTSSAWERDVDLSKDQKCRLLELQIRGTREDSGAMIGLGRPAYFLFRLSRKVNEIDISFTIRDSHGTALCNLDSWRRSSEDNLDGGDTDVFECCIDELPLRAGRYSMDIQLMMNRELQDSLMGEVFFTVEDGVYRGRVFPYASTPGPICIDHRWSKRC